MLAWLVAGVIVVYILLSLFLLYESSKAENDYPLERQKTAAVVVVGDLGHSPRMNFHALSIAKQGWKVTLIGTVESELMAEVTANESIEVVELPKIRRQGPFVLYALKRIIFQHYHLWRALRRCGRLDVVLVQNPPSIPTLGSARFFVLFTCPTARLIIDWHNLGHSILALSVKHKWMVNAYKFYEFIFGRVASIHITVSKRMGIVLRGMGVRAKRILPLYDRPYKSYVANKKQQQELKTTKFADLVKKGTKLVVTSTSYTPDEDLDLLLKGLAIYDKQAKATPLNVVITGKGPGKEEFLGSVADYKYTNVQIHTRWLPYEQYHQLLSVCDLGISLHKSSSGYDLPMKVVDMFGAGLPVLALKFPALDELVKEQENGLMFTSAESLAEALQMGLSGKVYDKIKAGALKEAQNTWDSSWDEKLGPVFMANPPPLNYELETSSSSDSD